MANKPNIRFKGFTDDWEQRKLGEDLESIQTGTNLLGSENNNGMPLLKMGNIQRGYFDTSKLEYLVDNKSVEPENVAYYGDFFFNTRNTMELVGKGATWTGESGKYAFNSNIARFKLKGIDTIFFNFLYNTDSMAKQVHARAMGTTSVAAIYPRSLDSIDYCLPCIDEQKRIGDYFRNLDHLITLHQRKCDETKKLKKFMLQKMFPKNGEKNPEIRFAGFTDDWEQRKLGEICERLTRKNKDNESDLPLTISSQHGLIDQRDFFNKVVAAKDMSEYYLLQKGEFAYNKSYSNGYDYGSIKRLNSYEKGCLSTLYICFKLISDKVNSDYLECYFDTLAWYHDVSQICSEGARNHGLLNVDVKAFFTEVTVKLPVDVKEQQQISAILHSLDHLITLHQRKCDKLKLIKKFMLQNMFPKKG